jgi:hypothetical protein
VIKWGERRARTRQVLTAADMIGRVLDGYRVARDVREHRIVTEWRQIVGERIATRTWPDGLKNGVLWVRVANSAWLQELSFLRDEVASRTNEHLGPPQLVAEVKFHIGSRRGRDPDDAVASLARRLAPRPRKRVRKFPPATPETLERIDAETAGVDDPDLRTAIRDVRRKIGL